MKGWLSFGAWSVRELAILLVALVPVFAGALFAEAWRRGVVEQSGTFVLEDGTVLEARSRDEVREIEKTHRGRIRSAEIRLGSRAPAQPSVALALLLAGFELFLLVYAAARERAKLAAWFRPGLRPAVWGVAGGLGLLLAGAAYERAIAGLGAELPDAAGMLSELFGPVGMLLVAGLLAPVAEEVYFRGRLFDAAREAVGLGWAIALSALAFAAVHGIPLALPAYFLYGAVLAWLREQSGGLVAPVLAHAVNNVAAAAIAFS